MDLNKEICRLRTFHQWPVFFIDKHLLAQTGFYYIGPTDLVKCHFCDLEIGMWQPNDNPIDEHLKWSLNCNLIRGRKTCNEPIDAEALKKVLPILSYDTCGTGSSYPETSAVHPNASRAPRHPEFRLESHRLISFEDWPRMMKQKPRELAEAGFYYTGKGDRVACFSCGGGLKDWEDGVVPWEQHAKLYSKCEYLKLIKGQQFIDHVNECKTLCIICCVEQYNTAFSPCGHVVACTKCARSLVKCQTCRRPFDKIIRLYFG